ncbi:DUF397 domain-containing protein [Streptomyces sp. NPDC020875]|uniref:DUF397 domain-containing protein n=1 Tax=Streptomyces sp. NPDC020875 TaxID=3154898 RepID=UPI0033EE2E36
MLVAPPGSPFSDWITERITPPATPRRFRRNGLDRSRGPPSGRDVSTTGGRRCPRAKARPGAEAGTVPVRDSKRTDGPVLMLSARAFTGLVALAKNSRV